MVVQIENMDGALPYSLALENLFDGLRANPNGSAAVLRLYGLL